MKRHAKTSGLLILLLLSRHVKIFPIIRANKAVELRGRVVNIVKNSKPPRSNISKPERSVIESLKKDKSIQILPADEGRATVVIDNSDYESEVVLLKMFY